MIWAGLLSTGCPLRRPNGRAGSLLVPRSSRRPFSVAPTSFKLASAFAGHRRKLQSRSASVEFQPVDEPRLLTRAYRFTSVLLLAARIYSRYKAIQLWSR